MKKYLIGFFVLFLFASQKQPQNKVAKDYYNDGNFYHKVGDYHKAIAALKKGATLLPNHSLEQAKYFNNIGWLYSKLTEPQYSQAILYYEKVLHIREQHNEFAGKHCKELGRLYSEIGEYSKSLFFQQKAIKYLKQKENEPNELAKTYIETSQNFLNQKKYQTAHTYLKKAEAVWKSSPEQHAAIIYNSIGNVYLDEQNYSKALEYYQKGLAIIQQHSVNSEEKNSDSEIILNGAKALNNIGTTYSKLKKWDKAKTFLEQGLAVKLSLEQQPKQSIASSYNNLGTFYLGQQLFKKAFINYNHSIQILTDTTSSLTKPKPFDFEYLPSSNELKENIDNPILVIYLHDKAKALAASFEQTKQQKHLEQAYKTYQKIDTLVHHILDTVSEESQGIWIGKVRNIYEDAIDVSHQLYQEKGNKSYLKAAFEFAESNKAVVMYRALQINQLKDNQRSKQLLQQIQSKLARKDILVEYFMGEKQLYIFNVTNKDIELHPIAKTGKLSEQLYQTHHFVSHYEDETTKTDYENYIHNAHDLYNTLLPNIGNKKRLIIVPDDSLYYTSFATFLHTKPTIKKDKYDLPYLIKKHQITYGFSSAILINSFDKVRKKQPLELKIYAPDLDSSLDLPPLNARDTEIKKLKNTTNADVEEGFVSLKHFYKSYQERSTLYFATHAAVSGDSAYLVFSDSILSTGDIYKNLDFNQQSIVLGACATGVGQLQKSEGTMSFTRAFMYKGSTNIISSLWNIDDEGTSQITNIYFQNLKAGKSSTQALHTAQLAYLDAPNRLHPKYWAAFTHTGVWTVESSSFNYWWLVVIGLILLSFGWFWYKR